MRVESENESGSDSESDYSSLKILLMGINKILVRSSMEEHRSFKAGAPGSNPGGPTKGQMADLEYAVLKKR